MTIDVGRLWYAGANGYQWPRTASFKLYDDSVMSSAYYLHFNVTGVDPSSGPLYRWIGVSLRCLTKLYCLKFLEILRRLV